MAHSLERWMYIIDRLVEPASSATWDDQQEAIQRLSREAKHRLAEDEVAPSGHGFSSAERSKFINQYYAFGTMSPYQWLAKKRRRKESSKCRSEQND